MHKRNLPSDVPDVWARIKKLRTNNVNLLAPKFRTQVIAMIQDSKNLVGNMHYNGKQVPFDPIVFETVRSDELQKIYFSQGTTKAQTAMLSWHFYGLAVDIISESHAWDVPEHWWKTLADLAELHGLKSGYRWSHRDDPHVYFGTLRDTPSSRARALYFDSEYVGDHMLPYPPDSLKHFAGLQRVWEEVGAL